VVNFTVIDSTGKFVSGLTLTNQAAASSAAASTADPACGGSNVTAIIAKFDGSNWQNLISRQRIPADAGGKYSVAAGNADPKPTAGGQTVTKADGTKLTGQQIKNADDAAAIADPTKRIVGVLQENTAGGYYTYYFATDVVKPLLFADAVDVQAMTQGKIANNGMVAVKDGKTVHRVGLQLCYVDPASKVKVVVSPTIDFTLNADGTSVPVKAADGSLTQANKVIDVASCNQCHEKLAEHGSLATGSARVDTNLCVMCHNIGSKDYTTQPASGDVNAGSSVSFKSMIHKLHGGKNVLTKNYTINGLAFKATDASGNVTGTEWPQDIRNCTKCHDNTKAAQADNWKNVPTRLACGSCHDGIDFTTGKGATLNGVYAFHVGGAQADDTKCALCHDATTIPVYHEPQIPSPHNTVVQSGVHTMQYKIIAATIDTNKFANVDFQILVDGKAVTFNANTAAQPITGFTSTCSSTTGVCSTGANFAVIYATGQDGITAPSDWNSGHDGMYLYDAWKGLNGNSLTLKDAATSTYTAVIKQSSATSRSGVVTAGHTMALPADAKMVTVAMKDSFTQDDGKASEASRANDNFVVAIPAMLAATGNTPDGKANVARRVIFSEDKCNTCHDRLGTSPYFHSGGYSIAMCATCHTPLQGGSTGWSASFRVWVHGIHGASKRTVPFTWHAVSKTDNYSQVVYPGVLKNCETCHLPGTYDFSASQYTATDAAGKTIVDNMLYVTAASGKTITSTSATSYVYPQASPVGSKSWAYGGGTDSLQFAVDKDFGTGLTQSKTTGMVDTTTNTTYGNNLVTSPIAAVCTTCHDSASALSHITTTGYGSFYRPRTAALAAAKEQCLFCHGPGKTVPIKDAHNPNWDFTTTPVKSPW
jgi:OmcA/MtrC family decaheme c-type cytochrome